MLISKFNRIIRSRIVWTLLGGVFALSLVVFIGPNTGSCSPNGDVGPVEGTLNGKPVSSHEFRLARFYELRMREPSNMSDEAQARLRQRVWGRIAALRAAEEMGITVSDEEMAAVIQRDPSFTDSRKGTFSKDLYARIIMEQLRTTVETFEDFLRQDMILQKVHQTMQSAVWSPASEISSKLNGMTDILTVQGIMMSRDTLAPLPQVSLDDARKLFEEKPDMFRIPNKRAVRYVSFAIKDADEKAPADEDVRAFYDQNADRYTRPGTNGDSVAVPIEEVRAEIVSNIQHRAAVNTAREAAMSFLLDLQPDRPGATAKTFEARAATGGMQIQTSRLFSANDRLPEFKAGTDFAKRAFMLDAEVRDTAVSDPVVGENAVFLMALQTNIEARLPDFKEVEDRAMRLARERRRAEMFQSKCEEVRKSVSEAVGAGKTLDAAVASLGVTVTNFPTFSIYSQGEEEQSFDYADAVKPAVMSLRQGDVSSVIPLGEDALVVYMKNRKAGDLLSAEVLRPELTSRINGYRANLLFSEWQDHLLKAGGLDDKAAKDRKASEDASL